MYKLTLTFLLLGLQLCCQAQKGLTFDILSGDKDSFGIVEIRNVGYQFISPLLDCYSVSDPGLLTIKNMKQDLNDYIDTVKATGKVEHISIYYRDLSNGPWMGINEKEFYSPASLLKVPIMIAALKYAQNNSDFLLFEVPFTKPVEKPQKNTVGKFLELGQKYTVKQLLEYMIISSDNEAKYLLTQLVPINFQKGVYMDLGVDLYKNTNDEDFLSVKEYASYFRILYNASYLDKENSEYALSVLSQSAYKKGIVAGIPDNIVVSHKFGVRKINSRKFNIQLHDCGIVYKNNQPYLLCVMTRGTEFEYLEEVISKISRIVYNSLKSGD